VKKTFLAPLLCAFALLACAADRPEAIDLAAGPAAGRRDPVFQRSLTLTNASVVQSNYVGSGPDGYGSYLYLNGIKSVFIGTNGTLKLFAVALGTGGVTNGQPDVTLGNNFSVINSNGNVATMSIGGMIQGGIRRQIISDPAGMTVGDARISMYGIEAGAFKNWNAGDLWVGNDWFASLTPFEPGTLLQSYTSTGFGLRAHSVEATGAVISSANGMGMKIVQYGWTDDVGAAVPLLMLWRQGDNINSHDSPMLRIVDAGSLNTGDFININDGLVRVNRNGQVLTPAVILSSSATEPENPAEGTIFFDSVSKTFFGWNGLLWKQLDN
jgi:hypothetical protein